MTPCRGLSRLAQSQVKLKLAALDRNVTGFSVFQHRLGHPRWHTKTIWAVKPEKPKGKEKRHTHTQTESGASAKAIKDSDLSSSAQGVGTSFRGHTHIRWQLPQMILHSEAGEIEWTDEDDLKQRVIYTTHPPHNTQTFGLRCKAIGPCGQREMLVKHYSY